jgi:branched-chain amino acid transport system substrate-binding protein
MSKKWIYWLGAPLVLVLMTTAVWSATYTISVSLDYTGPYAVLMPPFESTRKALTAWWNETKGKKLGIELKTVGYDMRYDASVVASTWPGILSKDKPIAHMGLGGPDVAALRERLPDDKVPMFMSTATYGYAWLPNTWVFQPRPTYAQEAAGFFNWVHQNLIKDRKIKIAAINSKGSPAYVDMINGIEAFCKATPWTEYVGVEWIPMKPVSLLAEVRRLSRLNPDFIWIATNTAHVISTIQAQKELGIHIPIVLASHNGIDQSTEAAKDIKLLEGHYDAYSMDPGMDPNVPGAKIVIDYCKKLGIKDLWTSISVQGALMQLMVLNAVERAAAKVGPDKITGQALYDAMFQAPITEKDLLGLAPTMTFTKEAPFSTKNLRVKITTVKGGKQVLLTKDWVPIPDFPKWVSQ